MHMIWFPHSKNVLVNCQSTCTAISLAVLQALHTGEAAKAGVDIIDTAISPFAHATSQPATETMIEMFKGTEWDLGLDLDKYIPLVDHFRKVKQQIAEEFNLKPASDVIPAVRRYQIPGGMLSNTQNQLNRNGYGRSLLRRYG